MSEALVQINTRKKRVKKVSWIPLGLGFVKPHHFWEMLKVAWQNRHQLLYALRILRHGVCDGCALGTSGIRDWTLDKKAIHLCSVRLRLLTLNTMPSADIDSVSNFKKLDSTIRLTNEKALRSLGRIPSPLRRRKGEAGFTQITWQQALEEIGEKLRHTDPDKFATFMTSRGISNEVYYAVQKAVRFMNSPNVDNAARLCHSPSTAAMKQTMGVSASTCSYKDWYGTDLVVFFGSNPANDQPVAIKYLYEAKKRGTRVLVVNTYKEPGMQRYWIPSTPDSALFGSHITDRFYQVTGGGDLAFIQAVQKILIEKTQYNKEFVDKHTTGFDAYAQHLAHLSIEDLITKSGASQDDVYAFAEEIAKAKTGVFVWSMGLTQHKHGTDTVSALCQLGLSKGFVGRKHCGLMPIRGHSGVQGGAEMGAYANVYPGGRPINPQEADRLEKLWDFRPPEKIGLDAQAIMSAAKEQKLDALYCIGGNFLSTLPNPQSVEQAFGQISLRIHQDIVFTPAMFIEPKETVYVLPAKTRYEHDGGITETTTERRVIYSPYIKGPNPAEAKEEWWIAAQIAKYTYPQKADLLGLDNAQSIREEIAKVIPKYEGIEKLKKKGDQFQWGGEYLCKDGHFPLTDGKARFIVHTAPTIDRDKDEFFLATRRGKQFNSMIQSPKDDLTGAKRLHVFMNKQDIDMLGLKADQEIEVFNSHGALKGYVYPSEITPSNIQMHWPEANILLNEHHRDPQGLVPDYNTIVRIRTI